MAIAFLQEEGAIHRVRLWTGNATPVSQAGTDARDVQVGIDSDGDTIVMWTAEVDGVDRVFLHSADRCGRVQRDQAGLTGGDHRRPLAPARRPGLAARR